MEELLRQFEPKGETQVLRYVDDLLVSEEEKGDVRQTTTELLNFLWKKGLKVSKAKMQFVESEVKYLGHIIGSGYKKLSQEHLRGILPILPPKTKRDVRKLLGLIGYCKLWIDEYTGLVKFLYEKLVGEEPIRWTIDDDCKFKALKEKLVNAPVLSLPDLNRPFGLFTNVEKGIAFGILTQEWCGARKHIYQNYWTQLLEGGPLVYKQ